MEYDKVIALMPARFAARRFPGKLIADIGDRSVLKRTYDQVVMCDDIDELYVVTADDIIKDHCKTYDIPFLFFKGAYRCGTDRCVDAYRMKGLMGAILINVQAEQPFIDPDIISTLIKAMKADASIRVGSLMTISHCTSQDPNVVKVSVDDQGDAKTFTRALISGETYHQHIGVYGFRTEILTELSELSPSSAELKLSLEQLRWMDNGMSIRMIPVDHQPVSIDTPSQLLKIKST